MEPEETSEERAVTEGEEPASESVRTPERRQRRKLSWWQKIVGSAMVLVLGSVALLIAVSQTDWGRRKLSELTVEALHRELGLEAELEEVVISWDLLPPGLRIEATGIALDRAAGRLLEAHGLIIRPSLSALLSGQVDLEEIVIDRPDVRLRIENGAIVNLPELPEAEASEGPVELPFQHVAIREGRVGVSTDQVYAASLDGVGLDLFRRGSVLDIALDVDGGELVHAGGTEPIRGIRSRSWIDLASGRIESEETAVNLEIVGLGVRGAVLTPPYESTYRGEISGRATLPALREIPELADAPWMEGELSFRIDVNAAGDTNGDTDGAPAAPEPEGEVAAEGADADVFATIAATIGDARARGEIDITNGGITNPNNGRVWGFGDTAHLVVAMDREGLNIVEGSVIHLIRESGEVSVQGSIGLSPGLPVDADIQVRDFELAALLAQFGVGDNVLTSWPMNGELGLEGTIIPPMLSGPVRVRSTDFAVTMNGYQTRPRELVLGVDRGRVNGRWRITDEAVRFEQLKLRTPRSRVSAEEVHLGFDNDFRVVAEGEHVDLSEVSPLVGVQIGGAGHVNVLIDGTFDEIDIGGAFDIEDFMFGGVLFGSLRSDFSVNREIDQVTFPQVRARKGASRYQVENLLLDFRGVEGSDRGLTVTGRMNMGSAGDRGLALQDAYHAFGLHEDERFTPFQSWTQGEIDVRYTVGGPNDGPHGTLGMDVDVAFADAVFAEQRFSRGRLAGRFRWYDWGEGLDTAEIDLDHFGLEKGRGHVNASGRMERGSRLFLSVSADQLAISELDGINEDLEGVDGTLSLLGEVRGTTDVPRAHLDVAVAGLRREGRNLGDGRLYVRLTDRSDPWIRAASRDDFDPGAEPCGRGRQGFARGRWRPSPPIRTVDGWQSQSTPQAWVTCGELLEGSVALDLAIGWTDVYPLRGDIRLRELDLQPFLDEEGGVPIGGGLSGRVSLHGGAIKELERLSGEARFDPVVVSFGGETGVALRNTSPVAIDVADGEFLVRQMRLRTPSESTLEVRGSGDVDGRLDLGVTGRMDLALIPDVLDSVAAAEGTLDLEVSVSGTVDDPSVDGSATLQGQRIALEGFPADLRDMNGRIRFDARRAELERFSARFGGGRVRASGAALMQAGELQRYAFDVGLSQVALRPSEGVEIAFGADTRVSWEEGDRLPAVTGEIEVERARYERAVSLSPTIGELYRPQRASVQRYDPEADRVALDLRIVGRQPVRIVNNILDMTLAIDDRDREFRVVGTDQRYGVVGALDIPAGTIRFRNTEFSVDRGAIRFDDETRVDPNFDVVATAEIRRSQIASDLTAAIWRIQLRARGNMDAFRLDADSQPQLSREDLMLLLTIGMTSFEAQQIDVGDVGGTALEALSAISGVNDEVADAVQVIDDFAITTRYSQQTGRPEPMVTVGKRISDRVRLSASTGLTGEQRTIDANLEFQVSDQTSVQLSYDNINRETSSSFGNVGVDFHWRLEFD